MAESEDPVFKAPQPLAPPQPVEPPPDLPPPLTDKNPPEGMYFVEIMKNGSIISRIEINKNRTSFGRSREADVPLDHPSISRYHAVILWKESENSDRGYFYLMDLNSTHGSLLNKNKVCPGTAVKIPIGNNVIKFGGSTRYVMLNSAIAEAQEVEDESGVRNEIVESKDTGCSWGMREDACAEDDQEENEEAFMEKFTALLNTPQSEPSPNENAFCDNPQKTLQIWFDQEGYDFEYQVVPEGSVFKAVLQLPIEGRDVPIEGPSQSKKKEAITQLCLKVCKLLDRAERLFPWQHQNNRKRNRNKIEEDEEEDLYDETEQSKSKKAKKLLDQKMKEKQVGVETYESLKTKYEDWSKKLKDVEDQLKALNQPNSAKLQDPSNEAIDPLDQFMECQLANNGMQMEIKIEKSKLKMKIKDLEKKISNCEKLMIIAKPTHIPSFKAQSNQSSEPQLNKVARECNVQGIIPSSETEKEKSVNQTAEPVVLVSESNVPSKFQMKITQKNITSSKVFSVIGDTIKNETKHASHMNVGLGVGASLKEMKQKVTAAPESHEDFIDWVPPKNQDGSGKTSLNDRFGY